MRCIEPFGCVVHGFRYKCWVNSRQAIQQALFYICASDKLLHKILRIIDLNVIKCFGYIGVVDFCANNSTSLKTLLSRPVFRNFKCYLLLQMQIECKIDLLHASFACK